MTCHWSGVRPYRSMNSIMLKVETNQTNLLLCGEWRLQRRNLLWGEKPRMKWKLKLEKVRKIFLNHNILQSKYFSCWNFINWANQSFVRFWGAFNRLRIFINMNQSIIIIIIIIIIIVICTRDILLEMLFWEYLLNVCEKDA